MQTPQNFGSTQKAEHQGGGLHSSALEGGEEQSSLRSRVVGRTMENVGTFLRDAPSQLTRQVKSNPLAVLGVGIGLGVAIGAALSPLSRLFTPRSKMSEFMAYRKQILRALGI